MVSKKLWRRKGRLKSLLGTLVSLQGSTNSNFTVKEAVLEVDTRITLMREHPALTQEAEALFYRGARNPSSETKRTRKTKAGKKQHKSLHRILA